MAKAFYITTAIDYVNASPHIGHAFEKVLADVIARWKRLNGLDVWFLTGTDENAQKNALAARQEGMSTKDFVDRNSKRFIELNKKLGISNDDFIRTTEPRHIKTAQEIFKKVYDNGDIYKGKYEGYYCPGCEAFKTEKELVDGKCPEHNRKPDYMSEDAYFFRLSKYKKQIIKFARRSIIPESRKNEILSRLEEEELKDLCVSRTNIDWGIDSPIDKKFKIYVWFDALVNYISGSNKNWPADVHVIGKGINWFHSVIWPAILISAGYALPKKVLVHGYLNLGGQKISKSLGNVVDPLELAKKYPVDSIRYSLLRCAEFDDSEYSEKILVERNNSELANKIGNLISRVSALAEQYGIEKTDNNLIKKLKLNEIKKHLDNLEIDRALTLILEFIEICNEFIQEKKPWETKDKKILYELSDSIKAITILLWPYIPESCEKIAKIFGFKISIKELSKPLPLRKIKKAEILFKKIDLKDAEKHKEHKIEGILNMATIKFDEWQKLDLRVGKIIDVKDHPNADKLYILEIDLGKLGKRTLVAGLKQFYKPKELKGQLCIVFANLEPAVLRGVKSEGMVLAAVNDDKSKVVLIQPSKDIEPGSIIS